MTNSEEARIHNLEKLITKARAPQPPIDRDKAVNSLVDVFWADEISDNGIGQDYLGYWYEEQIQTLLSIIYGAELPKNELVPGLLYFDDILQKNCILCDINEREDTFLIAFHSKEILMRYEWVPYSEGRFFSVYSGNPNRTCQ